MPKTVADVLKETGWTDDEIKALDQTKMEGLTRVVSSANESQEKAEFALRAQREEYDQRIAPALANWADQDTVKSTRLAAAEEFIRKVKDSGYLPKEILDVIPTITPGSPSAASGTRGPDGKFVPGANASPGSPGFVDVKKELATELGSAFSFAADTQWNYRRLHGKEMPDSPTALIREAAANRMSPSEWAAKKYEFAARETAIKAEEQKKHDDAIRQEVTAAKDKEWAEKIGNNPNVRIPQESAFSSISKAQAEGKRQDPLKMTPEQRKANTHANIQKEFAERSSMVN
jgi:hypothetical protein